MNEGGIRMKPITVTGSRRAEGSIQAAYRTYLSAYLKVQEVMSNYDTKLTMLKEGVKLAKSMEASLWQSVAMELGVIISKIPTATEGEDYNIDLGNFVLSLLMIDETLLDDAVPGIQGQGTTVNVSPKAIYKQTKVPGDKSQLYYLGNNIMMNYVVRHKKQMAAMYIDMAKGR